MKNLTAIVCIALLQSSGCIKKANPPVAGTGGSTTLVLLAQHHGFAWPIDTCILYIKYNATDYSTGIRYDDSTTCICYDSVVTCTFKNLKNGNYYIATDHAFDSSRDVPLKSGEVDVTIMQQNTTVKTTIPVSE